MSFPQYPTPPRGLPPGFSLPQQPDLPGNGPLMSAEEIAARREQFIELILRQVVLAVANVVTGGQAGHAFDELQHWAENLPGIGDIVTKLQEILGAAFGGVDITNPRALVEAIRKAIGTLFNGILPVSWIADVIEDLIQGAGQFLDGSSIADNPFMHWDPNTPGMTSGFSGKMTANGTWQSVRGEIFDVVPGNVVKLPAATKWSGVTATPGSNPIKVGFATWDAAGNALPDVITGQVHPSTASAPWQPIATTDWIVPAGVARAASIMTLDSGALSGDVWFSNVSSFKSNKMAPNIVESLIEGGQNLGEDIQKTWNNIWNAVFGGNESGKTPDDVKTATAHVTSVANDANAAAQFASSMVIRPRRSPRWMSTGTHDDVSFPIALAQSMFTPALGDITYIPITPDTDRVYKALKFGLVGNVMTNLYVGVYKFEYDGTLTRAVYLGDVKSALTASKVQTFAAPGGVSVGRGETVYLAVRQVGGTAGQMFTTPSLLQVTEVVQPVPTYITEKNNTGTGLPATISGAIVRSESAPAWGALGETLLDSPWTDYTVPGWYTYLFGADSRYVYIAGSSAGGGGGGGDGGWNKPGEGGRRGNWAALSLERGVGIPWDVPGLDVYVPAPGAGSPSRETNGSPGEALIVRLSTAPGTVLLNIPGGAAGRLAYGGLFNRDPVGEAQINYPFFGRLFVGGLAAAKDTNGNSPGGGGGGGDGGFGGNANAGRPGGAGFCAIRTA